MLDLLKQNPQGIVVKPNEGTGGISVFKVRTEPELEVAANEIFSSERSLAISPYVEIDDEIRVILIDYRPIVVFSKNRLSVVGDGKRSVLELAIATFPAARLSAVLSGLSGENQQGFARRGPARGPAPRPELASQPRRGSAGRRSRAQRSANCRLHRDCCGRRAIDRNALRLDRYGQRRRRLESPGNQFGRHDGSAEPVSSRVGRCGLQRGAGSDLRLKGEPVK